MTDTIAAHGKEAAYHSVPAEDTYGYAQAIKIRNMIYVSGQLSHDDKGSMIAPAPLDNTGKPADLSMMAGEIPALPLCLTLCPTTRLPSRRRRPWRPR